MSTPQPPGIPDEPTTPVPAPAAPPAPPSPRPAHTADQGDTTSTWQPWLYFRLAVVGLAIAYVVGFIVQNTDQIKIDFIFADARVHLIWTMLLLLGLGILLGVLLSQLYRHRRRAQLVKRSGQKADARADLGGRDKAEGKPG